ncbi:MAG: protein phosphatase 2C domain-containing protein [Candidatus Moraniibacteriota bacterium]
MIRLSADHHFSIGREHVGSGKPCQDHALSMYEDGMACAVISDGCSAGGETDMGARVLTFGSIAAIRAYYDRHDNINFSSDTGEHGVVTEVGVQQRIVLGTVRHALGLARDDMLATCGYAFATREGGVIHLVGDGVIATKARDGSVSIFRYDWGKVPFYPQYREESGGAGYVREHGDPTTPALFEEHWSYDPISKEFVCRGTVAHAVIDGMRGITQSISKETLTDYIDVIAVFTDGVLRVDGVDWKDVVIALLSFKTTKGVFVKRRMIRALKDFCNQGKGPMDDIAYAVIHVEIEPIEQGDIHGNSNQDSQSST